MENTKQTVKAEVRHNGKSRASQMKYHAKKGAFEIRIERDLQKQLDEEFPKRCEKRKHKQKQEIRETSRKATCEES